MNRSCSYLWVVVLILFGKTKKQAVCDRGYVGAKVVLGVNIILPKKALPPQTNQNHPFFQPSKSTKLLFIQHHKKIKVKKAE
jgi:hypothetical protein